MSHFTPAEKIAALRAHREATQRDAPTMMSPIYFDRASGKSFQAEMIDDKPFLYLVHADEKPNDGITNLGLEMYFQVSRYVNALLKGTPEEAFRITQPIVEALLPRINEDPELIRLVGENNLAAINTYLDQQRPACLVEAIRQVVRAIPAERLNSDWEAVLPEHTAGAYRVFVEGKKPREYSVLDMPSQSSHSKKHQAPAIAPITQYAADGTASTIFRCPSLVESSRMDLQRQIELLINHRNRMLGEAKPREPVVEATRASEDAPGPAGAGTGAGAAEGSSTAPVSSLVQTPMIYNLLTSFPSVGIFRRLVDRDHQGSTASKIFAAAHAYNRDNPSTGWFLPLNIPVNQQSARLRIDGPVTQEAFILAHLAIANSTLTDVLNRLKATAAYASSIDPLLKTIEDMNDIYRRFLNSGKAHLDKTDCERFRDQIQQLQLRVPTVLGYRNASLKTMSHSEKLHYALIKLFYQEYGLNVRDNQGVYGSVIQALHMATSTGNVAGCKSANDRFGFTYSLVETLRDPSLEMTEALDHFIQTGRKEDGLAFLEKVHEHNAQNHLNAGVCSLPSCIDTGPFKLKPSDNTGSLEVGGTRVGTFRSGGNIPAIYRETFKAKNAEKTQAHKKTFFPTIKLLISHLKENLSPSPRNAFALFSPGAPAGYAPVPHSTPPSGKTPSRQERARSESSTGIRPDE
jgi:hypothetical protein